MQKRLLMAIGAFWIAEVVAIAIMSNPGTMSTPFVLAGLPLLATVGLFVCPFTFVAGVHGLIHGYGSEPLPYPGLWIALAYLGYLSLFAGVVMPKSLALRIACLLIEAACALVAAKGIAYCI